MLRLLFAIAVAATLSEQRTLSRKPIKTAAGHSGTFSTHTYATVELQGITNEERAKKYVVKKRDPKEEEMYKMLQSDYKDDPMAKFFVKYVETVEDTGQDFYDKKDQKALELYTNGKVAEAEELQPGFTPAKTYKGIVLERVGANQAFPRRSLDIKMGIRTWNSDVVAKTNQFEKDYGDKGMAAWTKLMEEKDKKGKLKYLAYSRKDMRAKMKLFYPELCYGSADDSRSPAEGNPHTKLEFWLGGTYKYTYLNQKDKSTTTGEQAWRVEGMLSETGENQIDKLIGADQLQLVNDLGSIGEVVRNFFHSQQRDFRKDVAEKVRELLKATETSKLYKEYAMIGSSLFFVTNHQGKLDMKIIDPANFERVDSENFEHVDHEATSVTKDNHRGVDGYTTGLNKLIEFLETETNFPENAQTDRELTASFPAPKEAPDDAAKRHGKKMKVTELSSPMPPARMPRDGQGKKAAVVNAGGAVVF